MQKIWDQKTTTISYQVLQYTSISIVRLDFINILNWEYYIYTQFLHVYIIIEDLSEMVELYLKKTQFSIVLNKIVSSLNLSEVV